MANIQPTVKDVGTSGAVKIVTWVLTNSGDVGLPFRLDRWAVTSWQLAVNAPGALAVNGSNDWDTPVNFASMSDWAGASLGSLNALGFKTPRDMPAWIQCVLTTAGAGPTTVSVTCHRTDMGAVG